MMMIMIMMRSEMMVVIMIRRSERVGCDRTSHSSRHTGSSPSAIGFSRLQPVSRGNDVWLEPAVRTQAWINGWMDASSPTLTQTVNQSVTHRPSKVGPCAL